MGRFQSLSKPMPSYTAKRTATKCLNMQQLLMGNVSYLMNYGLPTSGATYQYCCLYYQYEF